MRSPSPRWCSTSTTTDTATNPAAISQGTGSPGSSVGARHRATASSTAAATSETAHGGAPRAKSGPRATHTAAAQRSSTTSCGSGGGSTAYDRGEGAPVQEGDAAPGSPRRTRARAPRRAARSRRGPSPWRSKVLSANRLVRFETGSSSEPVLAIHSVVTAKTRASRSTCRATASPTGVSSTAVVSSESTTVQPDREQGEEQPQRPRAVPPGVRHPVARRRRTPPPARRPRRPR